VAGVELEAAREICAAAVQVRLASERTRWLARKEQARARRAKARARELRPRLDDLVEVVDPDELLDVIVELTPPRPRPGLIYSVRS
jgi:hypothetical protein